MCVCVAEEWKFSAGTKQRAGVSSKTEAGKSNSEREEDRVSEEEQAAPEESSEGEDIPDEFSDFIAMCSESSDDGEVEEGESGECGEGFVEDEAEEVMCSESSDDGEVEEGESGESGDEEEGFVVDERKESSHPHLRRLESIFADSASCESSDDGEAVELESEGSTSDGRVSDSEFEESGSDNLPGHLRWKKGLSQRAVEGFQRRQTGTAHLQRLIYSDSVPRTAEGQGERGEVEEGEREGEEEVGGLFHVAKREQLSLLHNEDSSRPSQQLTRDWTGCVAAVKRCLFVTGDWGEEDAATLLRGDSEDHGDFEDLETGERFGQPGGEEEEEEEDEEQEKRLKKKKEQKVQCMCLCGMPFPDPIKYSQKLSQVKIFW